MSRILNYPLLFIAASVCSCSFAPKQDMSVEEAVASTGRELNFSELYSKPMQGDYWATRYSYPTNQFDSAWLAQSRLEHNRVPSRLPEGVDLSYLRVGGAGLSTTSFTELGPKPLGTGAFRYSGRVNVVVSHPSDSTIAYIGVDGGGVWKTTNCCDAATTWSPTTDGDGFTSIAIGDLILDPNDSDTLYAGTGDLRYGSYSFGSAGLLKSSDAGASWVILGEEEFSPVRDQPAGEFPQYQAIGKVRVDPRNSNSIVVGTKTGLFFSYDAGLNWDGPCLSNGFNMQRQDTTGLLVSDNGMSTDLYAAIGTRGSNTPVQADLDQNGANGIYKTIFPASGCPQSWSLVSTASNGWPSGTGEGTAFPTNSIGRIDLAMSPSDNDVIYAQVADISTRSVRGVWRTSDAGLNWVQVATNADISGCGSSGNQAWYDMGLSVDPADSDTVFLSAVDLFRSTNGGDTFTNITCGYAGGPLSGDFVHVDHHARSYVAGDSDRLLFGSDGGVYITDNARAANAVDVSSIQMNDTISTMEFYSGDISSQFLNAAPRSAVAGAQDNGSAVAVWPGDVSAIPWTRVNGGDGIYGRLEPKEGNRYYVESQNGNMRVSTSGPLGPYSASVSPWSGDSPLPFIFAFEINKYNCLGATCDQLIAGTYRVWETASGGLTNAAWYINSPDLTKGVLGGRSIINQLHYSLSDSSIAIVGTNDGNVQYGFGLGQGVTNTATWVDVTDGNLVLPNRPVLDVVTSADVATQGYAAMGGFDENTPSTPGHVFEVTCNADCSTISWLNKSGNLPNIPVDSVMVNPNIIGQVFAGTDWGLYYTNNIDVANPQWFKFTDGLPSVMIWDMAIDRGATTLAVFTRSRGAFAWPLPTELPNQIFSDSFEN